jgi:hypothetical protein
MAYDPATQWLLDQMHNPQMPIWRRIEIAKFLIESRPEEFKGQRRHYTTIVIEGAVSNAPLSITFPGTSPFATPVTQVTGDADHTPTRLN